MGERERESPLLFTMRTRRSAGHSKRDSGPSDGDSDCDSMPYITTQLNAVEALAAASANRFHTTARRGIGGPYCARTKKGGPVIARSVLNASDDEIRRSVLAPRTMRFLGGGAAGGGCAAGSNRVHPYCTARPNADQGGCRHRRIGGKKSGPSIAGGGDGRSGRCGSTNRSAVEFDPRGGGESHLVPYKWTDETRVQLSLRLRLH